MCCLAEKSASPRSRHQGYFGASFQSHKPRRLQDKAEEYFSNTSHGKFKFSKYFATESKQVTLVTISMRTDVAGEFAYLAKQWKKDTSIHSSLSKKFMHPAYQRIMAMGKAALPFILKELESGPGHWFYALRFIAGSDIAKGVDNLEDARQMWLDWGRKLT
jgi:hypothetical protein